MTNRLDAAIIHLKIYAGIKPVREHEYFSVGYGDTPPVPVRQEDIQAAIRILQAAAKVDKARALALAQEVPCDMDYGVYGLIAALPDDDGTPGEEGGGK